MNTIQAIETRYKGYRFRSRLEARWAVFFETLGVRWEYEPHGFKLPSGLYLPDFYIQHLDVWIEIKGQNPTERERSLAHELAEATDKDVFIFWGPINDNIDEDDLGWGTRNDSAIKCFRGGGEDHCHEWHHCIKCGATGIEFPNYPNRMDHKDGCPEADYEGSCQRPGPMYSAAIVHAYDMAIGARFEHGETP